VSYSPASKPDAFAARLLGTIAASIVETKGYGRESIHALTRRLRANLSYLLRNKRVVKMGDRLTARWTLPV
jgi:hypothetical protein